MTILGLGTFWWLGNQLHLVTGVFLEEMSVATITASMDGTKDFMWYGPVDEFLSTFKPKD